VRAVVGIVFIVWSKMESGRSATEWTVVIDGEFIHSSEGILRFMCSKVRVKEAILRDRGLVDPGRTEEKRC
jgi:hypothetical protein